MKELDDAHTRTREIVPHFIIASRYSHITMIIDGKKVFVDQAVEAMSEELFALEAKVRNQFTQGSGRPGRGQRIAYDEEKQLVKAALDEFIKKTRAPILEMKKVSFPI